MTDALRHCLIRLDWADGNYAFCLEYGEWLELKIKTKRGPQELFEVFVRGTWSADELREVIRVGLIGGGTEPVEALRLVRRYVEGRPLLENVSIALQTLQAGLVTPDGEQPKKDHGEAAEEISPSVSPMPTRSLQ